MKEPIPTRTKYPFADMEVGEVVFIETPKAYRVQAAAYACGSRTGKKFVTRLADGGVKVWRAS